MPIPTGRQLVQHELEHQALKLDEHITEIASKVALATGSATSGGGSGSGASSFSELTDVNFSTPPTDGQIFVWDALVTYTATLSPLSFGGNDYKEPALGGSTNPCIVYLFSQNPGFINSDGATFTREGTTNVHVGLIHWTDGSRSTVYVGDGVATSKAGFESIIQAAVDATAVVDNWKSDYFTYVVDSSYTGGALTGFDVAGAVTVVSGGNASPAISAVPAQNKLVPGTNYVPQHFGLGIFSGSGDSAQTVNNNTATVINLDTNTLYTNDEFRADSSSHGFILDSTIVTGGWGNVILLDDAGALIPTAVIELQKQNQDTSWTTQFAGLGGSLTFPFNYGDGQNNVTFRVRVTQTSGGSKSVFCQCHIYWDR